MFNHAKFPDLAAGTIKGGLLFAGINGAPRRAGNVDWAGVQPRLGFAYQLSPKMVIRGGWGRYFLNPLNDYQQTNGFSYNTPIVTSLDGGRTPIPNLLNNPFPSGITKPTGNSLGLSTFLGRSPTFFNPDFKIPYVNQFSFGVQLQLPMRSALEVSYVGNRSFRLQNFSPYNEYDLNFRKKCNPMEGGTPGYCDALVANPFYNLPAFSGTSLGSSATISRASLNRPFPQFSTFNQLGGNDGKYWYNSLQTTYQMRGYAGINLTFAYTFSKSIELGSMNNTNDQASNVPYQDFQKGILQKSVYSFDRPHSLKIGTVWELPFGKGRKLFNSSHSFWSRLAGGWQHTAMFQHNSGKPWAFPGNVVYLQDASLPVDWSAPKVYGVRPCVLKMAANGTITPQPYSIANGCGTDQSTYNFLFVPSSLYAPRMSPAHIPNLRLHAVPQLDMSINKTTRISEGMSIQFRAEFFNLTNTFFMSRQEFNTNLDDSNFGTITKNNVGQDQANFPRQIQFAVKFIF